jgi:hypothetical protein
MLSNIMFDASAGSTHLSVGRVCPRGGRLARTQALAKHRIHVQCKLLSGLYERMLNDAPCVFAGRIAKLVNIIEMRSAKNLQQLPAVF